MTGSDVENFLTRLLARMSDRHGLMGEPDASGMHEDLWRELQSAGYCDPRNFGEADPLPQLVDVLRLLGAHGASVPYVESVVLAPVLIPDFPEESGHSTVVDGLGARALAIATSGAGIRVSGRVDAVPHLRAASRVVIVGDGPGGMVVARAEPSSIAVEAAENLAREARDAAVFADVPAVAAAGGPRDADLYRARGWIAGAALLTGAMDRIVQLSTEFAKERRQFGKPISQFQAIQHHLAALASEATIAAAAVTRASRLLVEERNAVGAAAARICAGMAAGRVARIAHQVHGTIGFTDEYPLERLTRRLWSWRDDYGTERALCGWLGRRFLEAGADGTWPLLSAGSLTERYAEANG